jgi:hypothetical protein
MAKQGSIAPQGLSESHTDESNMPMRSLDDFAISKLEELERASLRRTLAESFREDGLWVERGGRRLLSFSGQSYQNASREAFWYDW